MDCDSCVSQISSSGLRLVCLGGFLPLMVLQSPIFSWISESPLSQVPVLDVCKSLVPKGLIEFSGGSEMGRFYHFFSFVFLALTWFLPSFTLLLFIFVGSISPALPVLSSFCSTLLSLSLSLSLSVSVPLQESMGMSRGWRSSTTRRTVLSYSCLMATRLSWVSFYSLVLVCKVGLIRLWWLNIHD